MQIWHARELRVKVYKYVERNDGFLTSVFCVCMFINYSVREKREIYENLRDYQRGCSIVFFLGGKEENNGRYHGR